MAEFVSVEVSNGVATLQLDRPPMNALCLQMQREIKAVFDPDNLLNPDKLFV